MSDEMVTDIEGRPYRLITASDYFHGYWALPESVVTRIFARWFQHYMMWAITTDWLRRLCRYDRKACLIPENELSPWWCVVWWVRLPHTILLEFATEVPARQVRGPF